MMAIWQLESEKKKKWSKVFDYFPKSVSIVTSKKKKIQTNKPAIAI